MSLPIFPPAKTMENPFLPHIAKPEELIQTKHAWHSFCEFLLERRTSADALRIEAKEAVAAIDAEIYLLDRDLKSILTAFPKLEGLLVTQGPSREDLVKQRVKAQLAYDSAIDSFLKASEMRRWAVMETQICEAFCAYMEKTSSQEKRAADIWESYKLYPARDRIRDREERLAYWSALAL
jgi:hypothetical protein